MCPQAPAIRFARIIISVSAPSIKIFDSASLYLPVHILVRLKIGTAPISSFLFFFCALQFRLRG